jgi:hypothetical protein
MAIHEKAHQIASHVAYELGQLLEDARELQASEKNSTLESFLMHARNLYDFFFVAPRPKMPDVSVQQFFDDGETWKPDAIRYCPYLTRERERLNRSIHHLSYDRLNFESKKQWEISTIVSDVTAVWNEFLTRLSPERRGWFSTTQGAYSPPANLSAQTQPSGSHDTLRSY